MKCPFFMKAMLFAIAFLSDAKGEAAKSSLRSRLRVTKMYQIENPNDYYDYRMLKLQLACESFSKGISNAWQEFLQFVGKAVQKIKEFFRKLSEQLWDFLIKVYGNKKSKRLIRLALYAKKDKVRKKNVHRILKIISK